jgi:hypothetical protein
MAVFAMMEIEAVRAGCVGIILDRRDNLKTRRLESKRNPTTA